VILLILVALLWIAVLAPGVITKLSDRRSSGSIDHFHDRLHLLERTGPKLIAPANRLEQAPRRLPAAVGYGQPPPLRPAVRSTLVLLETAEPESVASAVEVAPLDQRVAPVRVIAHDFSRTAGDFDDFGTPAVRMLDGPSLGTLPQPETIEVPDVALWQPPIHTAPTERRAQAARRRRDILGVLVSTIVLSGLLGIVPSLRRALIATAAAGFLLIVFIALALYAVTIRAERPRASDLFSEASGSERLRELEVSHVGPLHRLGDNASDEGDDGPELRRVVKAS
jgi:hypothetical protein